MKRGTEPTVLVFILDLMILLLNRIFGLPPRIPLTSLGAKLAAANAAFMPVIYTEEAIFINIINTTTCKYDCSVRS